jgi:IS605 OrfB family transposase
VVVKIVVQVKLLPDAAEASVLGATLRTVNDAANMVSAVAFDRRVFREYALRKHTYGDLKDRGLGAQAAQHVIRKTCHAYQTLQANIRAGNLGEPGSKRRVKAGSRPVTFRPGAAQPYDDRCLSWQMDRRTVSIWTTSGRMRDIRFACSEDALKTLTLYRQGESDLVHRDGAWFLIATCEVPETGQYEPDGFLGVDLGIVAIATTSDGEVMAGRRVNRYRRRQLNLRRKLQAKGTRSAKRLLRKRARKEARFARDVNHCISKKIVAEAERTSRGIALEDLTGIRHRARLRKPQRVTLNSWAFAQLGSFTGYKARRAGVPVVYVDPAWTSRTCADCGHAGKRNRVTQAKFICRGCGVAAHADRNASRNIAARGQVAWDAGRESRAPAPACHRPGLDAAASTTASDALAASSVPSEPSKLTVM